MKYKAIIFDAYGTLLDTGNGSVKAATTILKKIGKILTPRVFIKDGKSYTGTI
jgi:FMN phosphatase YigB (HAD superfamily)